MSVMVTASKFHQRHGDRVRYQRDALQSYRRWWQCFYRYCGQPHHRFDINKWCRFRLSWIIESEVLWCMRGKKTSDQSHSHANSMYSIECHLDIISNQQHQLFSKWKVWMQVYNSHKELGKKNPFDLRATKTTTMTAVLFCVYCDWKWKLKCDCV